MSDWVVKNTKSIADFFGVQPGTVRNDWVQAGMPGKRGSYDLSEIAQWWRDRLMNASKYQRKKGETDADLRYKTARANKAELEYKTATGEMVDKSKVIRMTCGLLQTMNDFSYGMIAGMVAELKAEKSRKKFDIVVKRHVDDYNQSVHDAIQSAPEFEEEEPKKVRGRPRKRRA